MKRKALLIILAALMLLTLCACPAENYNSFEPVTMPNGSEIVGNGGTVVQYGEYTYFVNGSATATADNTYNEVVTGAICRILTSDIDVLVEDNEAEVKIELVVPKAYYQPTKDSTGLYIKGDRIYFTTPGVEKNNNGEIISGQLSVISAKVDGSDVKTHLTIKVNDASVYFFETASSLYCMYLEEEAVYNVDLLTSNKPTELAKNITGVNADGTTLYATQKIKYTDYQGDEAVRDYNDVLKITPDGNVSTVLKGAKAENSENLDLLYTLVDVIDGKLYYTAAYEPVAFTGTFCYNGTESVRLAENAYTALVPYENGILIHDGGFIRYLANGVSTKMVYVSGATSFRFIGDTLYFVNSNILYKAELDADKPVEATKLHTTSMTVSNLDFDVIGENVFFLGSDGLFVANFNDDEEIVETKIAYVAPEEDAE